MLQRSGGFLPPVHTNCRVGFGVFSVKPGCHSSGTIRNYLVYLPPKHRVKKTRGYSYRAGKSDTPPVRCVLNDAEFYEAVPRANAEFRAKAMTRRNIFLFDRT
jgi:hypothetical protein